MPACPCAASTPIPPRSTSSPDLPNRLLLDASSTGSLGFGEAREGVDKVPGAAQRGFEHARWSARVSSDISDCQ